MRKIVEVTLRPLYEEKALLTVAFKSVAQRDDGVVRVLVDEGRLWNLGRVELTGAGVDPALIEAGEVSRRSVRELEIGNRRS